MYQILYGMIISVYVDLVSQKLVSNVLVMELKLVISAISAHISQILNG